MVVIHTGGVSEAAKEQSIETILAACQLKEEGKVRAVVAVGCMVERYQEELAAEIPEVDLFLGLTEMKGLIPKLRDMGLLPEADRAIPNMEKPLRIISTETPHTSFLKISEGCDHTCAFCAIPSFRGLHRSAPPAELVAEAQALANSGGKELTITPPAPTGPPRPPRLPGGPPAPATPAAPQLPATGSGASDEPILPIAAAIAAAFGVLGAGLLLGVRRLRSS